MTRLALACALALAALSAPGAAQERAPGDAPAGRPGRGYANPSAVIAAELGFSQLAQDKGQWTAFRETAAPEAEMFVPRRVNALVWLKNRANPPAPVKWQPHEVWMSCDGASAVTRGAWQGPNGAGYFTTVWQRQPKRGEFRWVLDQGDDLAKPLAVPDMIVAKVADCPPRGQGLARPTGERPSRRKADALPPERPLPAPLPATDVAPGADSKDGRSRDGTLAWRSSVMPDGARRVTAWLWLDGGWQEVLDSRVAARAGP